MADLNAPDPQPGQVTRIARRRALPGHEAQFEALVREMFGHLRGHRGFLGADLIPPERPGEDHQVVVSFTDEDALAAWDASSDRADVQARMRAHAQGEPERRRLSGLEAWFAPAVVPASMHPPRHRMALVTWLGIWPTASLALWLVAPLLTRLVMPRLARAMRPFLAGRRPSS